MIGPASAAFNSNGTNIGLWEIWGDTATRYGAGQHEEVRGGTFVTVVDDQGLLGHPHANPFLTANATASFRLCTRSFTYTLLTCLFTVA